MARNADAYRFVRHPIYTGVILMVLGPAILWGRIVGVIVLSVALSVCR